MQRRMCVHAHYIPDRRNSCQVLYGEQRTAKEPPKSIFFSGLEGNVDLLQSQYNLTTFTSKEGQSCVLIFRSPSHFLHFQNCPPQNQASWKLCPTSKTLLPRDVINYRSLGHPIFHFQSIMLWSIQQVTAWAEWLKRPPAEKEKVLFNDPEGSK